MTNEFQRRTLTEILDDELQVIDGDHGARYRRLYDSLEAWKDQQLDDALRSMKVQTQLLHTLYSDLLRRTEAQEGVLRELQIMADDLRQRFQGTRVQ